jgi:nitrate reductase gamma subunit
MSDRFLFATAPGVALVLLPAAMALRYLLHRQQGRDLAREHAQAVRLFRGTALWRYGLLLLVAFHVFSWLFPRQIILWNRSAARLLTLEAVTFLVGTAALLGLVGLLRRHFFDPATRAESSVMDTVVLALLFIQIVSGIALAILYRWAAAWSTVTLTPYVASVVALQPRIQLVANMPYVVKLHVVATVCLLVALPWTRLVYFPLYPLHRALAFALSPALEWAGRMRARASARWRRMVQDTSFWNGEED